MAKRLRRFSTSFKIILTLLALILAGYLFRTFTTGTKQVIVADTVVISYPIKKHFKKHRVKNYVKTASPAPTVNDTPRFTGVLTVIPKLEVPKQLSAVKLVHVKQLADSTISADPLYTTYVQPNITGIVKLRAIDNFNSNSLADIPAKSKVQVLAKGTTYYKVAYNNNVGYVPKWALQIK